MFAQQQDTMLLDKVKQILNSNYKLITTLESDGSIDFESPGNSGSGTIISSVCKPDSIFAKLKGPFGITGALILITRKNFIYYNVQENFVIKGPTKREYLKYIIRVGLDFDELLYVLTGSIFINDSIYSKQNIFKSENKLILKCSDTVNSISQLITINPINSSLMRYELFEKKDTASIIIEYTDYKHKSGVFFPYSITITRPSDKEFLKIEYSEILFNSGKFSFKLNPPASAKIIDWE